MKSEVRVPHANVINPESQKIVVQTQWNERELIKQIPGSGWDNDAKLWTVPLTWPACLQLRGIFGESLTLGLELIKWAKDERDGRVDLALQLRNLTAPENDVVSILGPYDQRLRDFQKAGVDFMWAADSCILGDDMGSGKTVQALELLRLLEQISEESLPALVVCPNSMKYTWALEAATWFKSAVPYVVDGGLVTRRKIFQAAQADPCALVIINYEGLRSHSRLAGFGSERLRRCVPCGGTDHNLKYNSCEAHNKELNVMNLRTVILDEAHKIKDPHAKQTRAAWAVGRQETVSRRYALTGTVIANDPSDAWSILHFINPLEHPTKTKYVDRYCLQAWNAYGGLDVKGIHPATRQEFYQVLDPRFRRMPKALVLSQLPPKIHSVRHVELTPKQRKAYRDIDKDLVTRLPDGSVMVAANDLVAQTRLLQFASATMEQTMDGFRMCDPSSKVDALLDILEERDGKPTLVSAMHVQLINLAAERLTKRKIQFGLVTGAQQNFERQVAIREFQAGKLPVLMFTLGAGGTGLTLTAADTQVRLQRSWSLIDNLQGADRNHRIGSEIHDAIHYIDVVAQDTVEEMQVERLWEKSERLEEINRDRAQLQLLRQSTAELDAEEAKIMHSNLGTL